MGWRAYSVWIARRAAHRRERQIERLLDALSRLSPSEQNEFMDRADAMVMSVVQSAELWEPPSKGRVIRPVGSLLA